jgi:antitoxin ParD1/3/4
MPTRNVVLTEHQASLVEQLVASGRYQNASEVLREGLRLIERRESEDAFRLEALRHAVKAGGADFDHGRFSTFESSVALGAHLDALASKAIANT